MLNAVTPIAQPPRGARGPFSLDPMGLSGYVSMRGRVSGLEDAPHKVHHFTGFAMPTRFVLGVNQIPIYPHVENTLVARHQVQGRYLVLVVREQLARHAHGVG